MSLRDFPACSMIETTSRTLVGETLRRFEHPAFGALAFPAELEEEFEEETRKARSFRMWAEGLVAIVGLNLCLLMDYLFVHEIQWLAVVRSTLIVTPIALATNALVYFNPRRWIREGSIALAMVTISVVNMLAEGKAPVTGTLYGVMCLLITALFAGVVMRLRFPYAVLSIATMAGVGFWGLRSSPAISASAAQMGGSLLTIGLGIIVVASFSLERAERCSYLLSRERKRQTEELAFSNEALLQLSRQDTLTGLPNRRAFEERFEQMWEESAVEETMLAVVLVDVDHFKQVNDKHGHLFGDETLQRVGQLLNQALRSPDDMTARYGGEEFVILLPGASPETAQAVAERARQLIETAGTPRSARGGTADWITVSCGVSWCVPLIGGRRKELIAVADEALYLAKRTGRNRVVDRAYDAEIAKKQFVATGGSLIR